VSGDGARADSAARDCAAIAIAGDIALDRACALTSGNRLSRCGSRSDASRSLAKIRAGKDPRRRISAL